MSNRRGPIDYFANLPPSEEEDVDEYGNVRQRRPPPANMRRRPGANTNTNVKRRRNDDDVDDDAPAENDQDKQGGGGDDVDDDNADGNGNGEKNDDGNDDDVDDDDEDGGDEEEEEDVDVDDDADRVQQKRTKKKTKTKKTTTPTTVTARRLPPKIPIQPVGEYEINGTPTGLAKNAAVERSYAEPRSAYEKRAALAQTEDAFKDFENNVLVIFSDRNDDDLCTKISKMADELSLAAETVRRHDPVMAKPLVDASRSFEASAKQLLAFTNAYAARDEEVAKYEELDEFAAEAARTAILAPPPPEPEQRAAGSRSSLARKQR